MTKELKVNGRKRKKNRKGGSELGVFDGLFSFPFLIIFLFPVFSSINMEQEPIYCNRKKKNLSWAHWIFTENGKKARIFYSFCHLLFARGKKKIKKKRSQLPKISKIDLLDKPWNYPKDYSTPPKLLFQQQAFVFEKQHFVPILSFCCFNQSLMYGRWNCLKLNETESQALPILLT